MWYVGAICWLSCGIVGAGFSNAYFQRKWPELREDRDFYGAVLRIFGGLGTLLAVVLLAETRYGWSFRRDAVKNWKPN